MPSSTTTGISGARTARPWGMLAAACVAQVASAITVNGPAFLIPALHEHHQMSLAAAGAVAAAPTAGGIVGMIPWGLVVDRRGERFTLVLGLLCTALFAATASLNSASAPALALWLFLAGIAAASTSVSSGRVVVGWFPAHRRGLAMGVRQMSQPVGVGIAAVTIAVLADSAGVATALRFPAAAAAVALLPVLLVVIDPPRTPHPDGRAPSPYVEDRFLWKIHGVSALLVVPQFLVWTFALVWLTNARDWSPGAAGTLVGISQVLGALGRIAMGQVSDRVGSRVRPLRWVSMAALATMALLGLADALGWSMAVPLMLVATVVTVADNGLAFTAVAERAGPHWSGRALGVQTTAQFIAAAAVPPIAGLGIARMGYPAVFALCALFPLLATPLIPRRDPPSS